MATIQRLNRQSTKQPVRDFSDALGASRTFPVVARPHGPFAVAALLNEIRYRLVSQGGRPADPAPTLRRLVPLKKQVWKRLQAQAELLSSLGKPVSPGQLAALLLEKSVADLESAGHHKKGAAGPAL